MKRWFAEFLGTAWLVLGGCGTAVIALGFPDIGVGLLGVSLAFGLSVMTAAYALGGVSGAHFNPAITVGLAAAGRFPMKDVAGYVIAQVVGAIAGAGLVYLIASGKLGFDAGAGMASNGYGVHSPGGYSLQAALVAEIVMTFFFLVAILGVTGPKGAPGFAPLSIGMTLALIHLVSIPVTNTSVNPARSTGPALFAGGWALEQLWVFWVAPIVGAIAAGALWRWFGKE